MLYQTKINYQRILIRGLIFFTGISVITPIFSQREIPYDLDSYKQVEYKRSELLISSDGGLNADDQINVEGENLDLHLNLRGDLRHLKFINSEEQQYTLSQRFIFQKNNDFRIDALRENTKRKYIGKRYLKTGLGIRTNYRRVQNENTFITETHSSSELKGDIGIGHGRIEYINHASSALQMLQALENNGLLLRIPSQEEITELANEIGRVRTSRILDFRLRDIAILEHMIKYFIESELIDSLSTMAILIIEDTFEYDEIILRQSGSRLEFSLVPKVNFITRPLNNVQYDRILYAGASGAILKEKFKNMNVKWMKTNSYGFSLGAQNQHFSISNNSFESNNRVNLRAELTHTYGYFYVPNLRNNLRLDVESAISIDAFIMPNIPTRYSTVGLRTVITATYNHYFSPSTQLVMRGRISYNDFDFLSGAFQPIVRSFIDFGITQAIF